VGSGTRQKKKEKDYIEKYSSKKMEHFLGVRECELITKI
jgi:hypothetical protein